MFGDESRADEQVAKKKFRLTEKDLASLKQELIVSMAPQRAKDI